MTQSLPDPDELFDEIPSEDLEKVAKTFREFTEELVFGSFTEENKQQGEEHADDQGPCQENR